MPYAEKTEDAYLAGVIDGEGWIGICFQKDHKRAAGRYHRLDLRIVSNTRPLLEWIRERYGGTLYGRSSGGSYVLVWTKARAEEILRTVRPWLIVKAEQADLAIEFRETFVRKGRYVKGGLEPGDFALREQYRRRLSAVNQRGGRALEIAAS